MAVIDFIFIGVIALLVIRGFFRGFIKEVFSMAGLVFGVLAALFLYKNGADFLRAQFWPDLRVIPEILAFVALFMIVFLIAKIIESLIKGIILKIKLDGADKFLGLLFGLLLGIAVVSLVLFLLKIQPIFNSEAILSGSFFGNLLLPLITGVASERMPGV